ncbi:hypothetical protein HUJ05_001428 [Dendroctonus ponderosae]|nr:hypothetical protein HUJ05_001428 [Dendroctonus ponderosae]
MKNVFITILLLSILVKSVAIKRARINFAVPGYRHLGICPGVAISRLRRKSTTLHQDRLTLIHSFGKFESKRGKFEEFDLIHFDCCWTIGGLALVSVVLQVKII